METAQDIDHWQQETPHQDVGWCSAPSGCLTGYRQVNLGCLQGFAVGLGLIAAVLTSFNFFSFGQPWVYLFHWLRAALTAITIAEFVSARVWLHSPAVIGIADALA